MDKVGAHEALNYALSREMLKIYGILALGDISILTGIWIGANWAVRGGTAGLIGQIIGPLLLLTGLVIGIVGFVAFIYKIIVDANNRAS